MCKQVRFGCHNSGYASEDESTEDNDIDQPDWMDVIKPITDFVEDSDFKLYDGGPDYDWSSSNHAYSSNLGQDFIEHLNNSETESLDWTFLMFVYLHLIRNKCLHLS
jgi:hypothetical protein